MQALEKICPREDQLLRCYAWDVCLGCLAAWIMCCRVMDKRRVSLYTQNHAGCLSASSPWRKMCFGSKIVFKSFTIQTGFGQDKHQQFDLNSTSLLLVFDWLHSVDKNTMFVRLHYFIGMPFYFRVFRCYGQCLIL
jgi:hypothetical protein